MCGGVVGDVLDAGQDVLDTVSEAGSQLDDFVNEEIPGGWATVGLAAGVYYAPEIGAYVNSEGAILSAEEAGAATNAGIVNTATGADLTAAYDMGAVGSAGAGGATAAGTTGGVVGGATAGGTTAAGTTGGVVGGATTGGAAAGAAGTGLTLGQVGSALAIASGINSLTGGSITKAITGNNTNVNTGGGNNGGGTGGGNNGGGGGGDGGNTDISTAAGALKVADPFSPYRSKLAEMYSGYLTGGNKTDITQMPGYSQFESGVLNPALEATKRAGAKSGMLMSGNEQIALQKQGQTGYYGFMTDYLNRLATASNASNNPYSAANLATNQANTQNQATMQGVGGITTGIAGLLNDGKTVTNLSNLFGGNNNSFTGSTGLDNSNIDYNYLNSIYSGGNPFEGQLSAGETWMGE